MNVTGIDLGEPVAPAAVTITAPVYVPAASPAGEAVTVSVPGALPDAGVTASHAASSAAL